MDWGSKLVIVDYLQLVKRHVLVDHPLIIKSVIRRVEWAVIQGLLSIGVVRVFAWVSEFCVVSQEISCALISPRARVVDNKWGVYCGWHELDWGLYTLHKFYCFLWIRMAKDWSSNVLSSGSCAIVLEVVSEMQICMYSVMNPPTPLLLGRSWWSVVSPGNLGVFDFVWLYFSEDGRWECSVCVQLVSDQCRLCLFVGYSSVRHWFEVVVVAQELAEVVAGWV